MTQVFAQPFHTRWLFDMEILARLICTQADPALPPVEQVVYELPLREWHDVAGSKLRARDFGRALLELAAIYRIYLRTGVRDTGAAIEPRPALPVLYAEEADFDPAIDSTPDNSDHPADPLDRPLAA